MGLPFRVVSIGKTPELALEYAQLKKLDSGIMRKKSVIEIRLPNDMTTSKLELLIWIAEMVTKINNIRELTKSEINAYQTILEEYGEDETKKILYKYGNIQSRICLAIPMTSEESSSWRRKTHRISKRNNKVVKIVKLENRNKSGKLWKLIGQS